MAVAWLFDDLFKSLCEASIEASGMFPLGLCSRSQSRRRRLHEWLFKVRLADMGNGYLPRRPRLRGADCTTTSNVGPGCSI